MTRLSVNVNKVALLRNSRAGSTPSVTGAARTAIDAGAQGITVHPRPDGRHIRHHDVHDLKAMLNVEFNIEGYPARPFLDLLSEVKPDQCTLVPDDPGQLTSDHGWNLERNGDQLVSAIDELKSAGIRVSLFMDPVAKDMAAAKAVGADRIELYTEAYARAFENRDHADVLGRYVDAAAAAHDAGLGINAGHDLNQQNLEAFIRAIPGVAEVSIGHAIVCEALYDGLANTVRAYVDILARLKTASI